LIVLRGRVDQMQSNQVAAQERSEGRWVGD
jgi:hypothetical protein